MAQDLPDIANSRGYGHGGQDVGLKRHLAVFDSKGREPCGTRADRCACSGAVGVDSL